MGHLDRQRWLAPGESDDKRLPRPETLGWTVVRSVLVHLFTIPLNLGCSWPSIFHERSCTSVILSFKGAGILYSSPQGTLVLCDCYYSICQPFLQCCSIRRGSSFFCLLLQRLQGYLLYLANPYITTQRDCQVHFLALLRHLLGVDEAQSFAEA